MKFWALVLFSHSIVSDYLQPHGLYHARPPCPSPSPGACSNSCPLSQWCPPTISSFVIHFSSCLLSFPALRSFPMSGLFTPGSQNVGTSASASVLPVNIHGWFPLRLAGLISLLSKGLSRDFSKASSSVFSLCYDPILTSIHDYWENHSFDYILGLGLIFFCSPTVVNESLIISYQGTHPAFTVGFSIACWSLITFHYLFPGYQWHSNKYPIPFSL